MKCFDSSRAARYRMIVRHFFLVVSFNVDELMYLICWKWLSGSAIEA